jgi:SAM-dependent methyltransferase
MQAYGKGFARVYNARWGGFARRAAPLIETYYAGTPLGGREHSLLDVCCGAGHLLPHFLEHGYRVTGVDLSPDMLGWARANTAPYVESGLARFVAADAATFSLDDRFGLVVSTYDALNHLPDAGALAECFRHVRAVTIEGGHFVFDLNTRAGLHSWNSIHVDDAPDMLLVNRSIYDEAAGRAYARLSGFVADDRGVYERFEQLVYNTAFDVEAVRRLLLDTGWDAAHVARLDDLAHPIADPEGEQRAWFVASC